jgi:hypothetical protein
MTHTDTIEKALTNAFWERHQNPCRLALAVLRATNNEDLPNEQLLQIQYVIGSYPKAPNTVINFTAMAKEVAALLPERAFPGVDDDGWPLEEAAKFLNSTSYMDLMNPKATDKPDDALGKMACIESIIRRHATGWIMDKEKPIADYIFSKAEEMATDIVALLDTLPRTDSGKKGNV